MHRSEPEIAFGNASISGISADLTYFFHSVFRSRTIRLALHFTDRDVFSTE